MTKFRKQTILAAALCSVFAVSAQSGEVKVWEGTLDIPTYTMNPPEKAPGFSRNFAYQRAKRGIYPYAYNDNIQMVEKVDSLHKALYLENDFMEICVLPGIGGRLFYALDKTDNYDIFYRQHVIKPANVGMLGAWISGGVEWNVFHHHRASSHNPVDYQLVENADGSKTIWVGEVEPRQRMAWAIGMTLFPDKSYVKITGRLINCTAERNSILYWSNVATSVNDDYQIIFPESTDFGVYHAKNSFVRWPMSDAPYCGNDAYTAGIDCSWWKNHPESVSIFAYDLQDDFIAGYDHGKKAGTMLVGNHNINKGGKLWQWGPRAYGHAWDCQTLTDADGPYVELMVSAYSDNQPDYCWLNPYEVKEFTSYWYGIRDLNNVKRGNQFATVNMECRPEGKLFVAVNTTERREGAVVKVVNSDGKVLVEKSADIAPDAPFVEEFGVGAAAIADRTQLTLTVGAASGEELISYTPRNPDTSKPMPETVKPPKKPSETDNIEELYFTGMRNVQFHNAHVVAEEYFEEALRRDPGDTRCNTQMGVYYRQRGEWERAAGYLRTALKRQTNDYTRPRDGESIYNLGLILKHQGKTEAATDTLYRAVWDYEYASPAYYQLAQMSFAAGNMADAHEQLSKAILYNGANLEAKNLLTTLLRKEGKTNQAKALAEEVLAFDPLNFYAAHELGIMGGDMAAANTLLRGQVESYLELAVYYLNNACPEEAEEILLAADKMTAYPTVKYYLGALADKAGKKVAAQNYFKAAAALPIDYCFPFRLETEPVYDKALEYLGDDAKTYYYYGSLMFDKQPDRAMKYWQKAVEIEPDFAMALRNLGWGYRFHVKDYAKAIEYYERAIAADRAGEATFLDELDQIYELTNTPVERRYAMLHSHHDVAMKRYESLTRKIRMMAFVGDLDNAYEYLMTGSFARREHIEDLHDIYVDVCLLSADRQMQAGNGDGAVVWCLRADEYPANHFYAKLEYYARRSQIYYMTAEAYRMAGNEPKAAEYYRKAAENETRNTDFNYFKALAQKQLNPKADVKPLYTSLVESGKAKVTTYVENFFESFDSGFVPNDINSQAYYTEGLGYMGLGKNKEAVKAFRKALECHADNLWANFYLNKLQ